jgi:2-methylisocitrate lyase-like PEP mutase family enzyme
MPTQTQRAELFRALHHRGRAFVIPNPWDIGSARLLARLQFEALATTSAGFAFSSGRPDGAMERDAVIEHVRAIAAATDLPVSADLENGFGDTPEMAAETIRMTAAAGAVGGSIEDVPRGGARAPYALSLAVERVRAAAEAAHALPFPFTLTARAENFIVGRPDLRDTIARLQAFQQAGADVLYAPGLATGQDIAEVMRSVDRPVNVLAPLTKGPDGPLTVAELSELGVARISVGGALARVALGALLRAAREMQQSGTFELAAGGVSGSEITGLLEQ